MAKNKKNDPPPDGLTDKVIANIRENIRKGHSFSSASRLAGVEPGVVFAKVRESPEFQRLLDTARDEGINDVLEVTQTVATKGQGATPGDFNAARWLLSRWASDLYNERAERSEKAAVSLTQNNQAVFLGSGNPETIKDIMGWPEGWQSMVERDETLQSALKARQSFLEFIHGRAVGTDGKVHPLAELVAGIGMGDEQSAIAEAQLKVLPPSAAA